MTEGQKRALCLRTANDMVERLREMNQDYYAQTGEPSRVSEADYQKARDEIEAVMLHVAGLRDDATTKRQVIVRAARDLALEVHTSDELIDDREVHFRVAVRTGLNLDDGDCEVAARYFDARLKELATAIPPRDAY